MIEEFLIAVVLIAVVSGAIYLAFHVL